MDGSIQATITATILGLAARIEREFISMRTKEALIHRKERRSIAKIMVCLANLVFVICQSIKLKFYWSTPQRLLGWRFSRGHDRCHSTRTRARIERFHPAKSRGHEGEDIGN